MMRNHNTVVILLALYAPLCFSEQVDTEKQRRDDAAWGRLSQPVHPHTRWQTYNGPAWQDNYQPRRWFPPVNPYWQNPYPPRRWQPPPQGPQWLPPPPTNYLWAPDYHTWEWAPVHPSQLPPMQRQ